MKAITLTQPWATLVAIGAKRIETRSWTTRYRGPLTIHAAKAGLHEWDEVGPWRVVRYDGAWSIVPVDDGEEIGSHAAVQLPLGAVVATADLVEVLPIRDSMDPDTTGDYIIAGENVGVGFVRDRIFGMLDQVPFGDFTPGRYAWLLANVRPLDEPVPARGALGLWEWEGAAGS